MFARPVKNQAQSNVHSLLKLVRIPNVTMPYGAPLTCLTIADEPDEDNMEEIDTDNIITDGRRTRGLQIDFVKAAKELEGDDDEEDDDDFEEPADEDKMEE